MSNCSYLSYIYTIWGMKTSANPSTHSIVTLVFLSVLFTRITEDKLDQFCMLLSKF